MNTILADHCVKTKFFFFRKAGIVSLDISEDDQGVGGRPQNQGKIQMRPLEVSGHLTHFRVEDASLLKVLV